MAAFKLMEHKNRRRLCPKNLPHPTGRQLLKQSCRRLAGRPAPLSFVYCLKEKSMQAHLAVQTKRSSLSLKEPLRSTGVATGCHCYSTHTIARERFRLRSVLVGTWAPLGSPLTELTSPSGGMPQASSVCPIKAI